jgi:octaprenyl-diphosphate synthase
VIRGKTAELFAAACEVGPSLPTGRRPSRPRAARSAWTRIAFQLVDDMLDMAAAASSARTSATISRGQITLPVVLAFRCGNDANARSGSGR